LTVKRRPRSTEAVARERGKQKEMDAPRVVAVQVERVFAEKHRTFSPSRAGARAARTGGTPIAADQSEKCPFASRKELTKLLPIERKEFHQISSVDRRTGTAIDRVRQTEKESDKKYDDVPGARARARRAASVPEGHLQHL
jgi:hypothetical protein